ncbi:LSU ribosomal protein L17p [Olavius algarvensis associated proteobacterium Delta 3]|nr:LSU ribosomal protein L17p [Olavius algarvensis associated proteobacterium Delta 3]
MRHRKSGIKLNRTGSHRKAMFRNMVTSLFKHDRIRTTDAKAKELRSWADRLITLAKRGDLHARRQALAIIREKAVVHKLFEDVQNRFGNRQGGYTRVIKLGPRKGDAAPISLVELVIEEKSAKPKKKIRKKPVPAAKAEEKADAAEEPVVADTPETKSKKAKTSAKKAKDTGAAEAPEKAKKKAVPKKKSAKTEKEADTTEKVEKKSVTKKKTTKAEKKTDTPEDPEKTEKKKASKKKPKEK